MMLVYGLKNCDSCRKAIKWLNEQQATFTFVDVRDQPVSDDELKTALAHFGSAKLVNRRSTTWRNLSESERTLNTDANTIALIRSHPTLMKRPLLFAGQQLALGFDPNEAAWQQAAS